VQLQILIAIKEKHNSAFQFSQQKQVNIHTYACVLVHYLSESKIVNTTSVTLFSHVLKCVIKFNTNNWWRHHFLWWTGSAK